MNWDVFSIHCILFREADFSKVSYQPDPQLLTRKYDYRLELPPNPVTVTNEGLQRFIGIPHKKYENPGGDCY